MYVRLSDSPIPTTVEPRLTVTSLVWSLQHYGHPCSVPIILFYRAKNRTLAHCNTVTSQLRSVLPRPVGERNGEVPIYMYTCKTQCQPVDVSVRLSGSSHPVMSQFMTGTMSGRVDTSTSISDLHSDLITLNTTIKRYRYVFI